MNMVADGVVCDRARWRWSHDITCMRAAAPGESTAGASSKVLLDRRPSCTETSSTAAAGSACVGMEHAHVETPSATPRHATPCGAIRGGAGCRLASARRRPRRQGQLEPARAGEQFCPELSPSEMKDLRNKVTALMAMLHRSGNASLSVSLRLRLRRTWRLLRFGAAGLIGGDRHVVVRRGGRRHRGETVHGAGAADELSLDDELAGHVSDIEAERRGAPCATTGYGPWQPARAMRHSLHLRGAKACCSIAGRPSCTETSSEAAGNGEDTRAPRHAITPCRLVRGCCCRRQPG